MSARLKTAPAFRAMEVSDLNDVLAVERAIYPYPWTRGNFSDSIKAGFHCRMMEWESVLIGYGLMMLALDEAHLLNLSIAAPWQRQGFGRRMLQHLREIARDKGAVAMFLEVRPSNLPACALYRAAGFTEVGERRNYYPTEGGRENARVMRLLL